MKKQILILFTMLFAGMATVFGQTITPRPIDGLVEGPLNPVAGVEYEYSVVVPTPPGDKVYQWFVTQHENFLEARDDATFRELIGDDYLAAGDIGGDGFYTDNTTATGEESDLFLTWKSFALDADEFLFVVIYVTNDDGEGCISDNLRVYRIDPVHAFTLDIANMGASEDYGLNIDVCPDDVQSAEFNPTGGPDGEGIVEFDFGQNILEYEIVAANFNTAYELHLDFSGWTAPQTYVIEWSRDPEFTTIEGEIEDTPDDDGIYQVVIPADDASGSVGADGEVIFIRITIDHEEFEGLTDTQYSLAINGFTGADFDMEEVYYVDGNPDGFDNDIALQTITARPTINPVAPLEFVPDNAQ